MLKSVYIFSNNTHTGFLCLVKNISKRKIAYIFRATPHLKIRRTNRTYEWLYEVCPKLLDKVSFVTARFIMFFILFFLILGINRNCNKCFRVYSSSFRNDRRK